MGQRTNNGKRHQTANICNPGNSRAYPVAKVIVVEARKKMNSRTTKIACDFIPRVCDNSQCDRKTIVNSVSQEKCTLSRRKKEKRTSTESRIACKYFAVAGFRKVHIRKGKVCEDINRRDNPEKVEVTHLSSGPKNLTR
jgi:hypothetical protein